MAGQLDMIFAAVVGAFRASSAAAQEGTPGLVRVDDAPRRVEPHEEQRRAVELGIKRCEPAVGVTPGGLAL
jgi:hypothetical protein